MPIESEPAPISSINAITRSIENDRFVYRWFLMLISLPRVRQEIFLQENEKTKYQTLKKLQKAKIATLAALGVIIAVSFLMHQALPLLLALIPCGILFKLFQKSRRYLAEISRQFLINHIAPEGLTQQTLYQTCEYLSQKYETISLVDLITYHDNISRKALLASVLLLPALFIIRTWQLALAVFIVLTMTFALVNTCIRLRKLK